MFEVLCCSADNRKVPGGVEEIATLRIHVIEPKRRRHPLFDGEPEKRYGLAVDEIASRAVNLSPPKKNHTRLDQFAHALLAAVEFGRLCRKAPVDQRCHDSNC